MSKIYVDESANETDSNDECETGEDEDIYEEEMRNEWYIKDKEEEEEKRFAEWYFDNEEEVSD